MSMQCLIINPSNCGSIDEKMKFRSQFKWKGFIYLLWSNNNNLWSSW